MKTSSKPSTATLGSKETGLFAAIKRVNLDVNLLGTVVPLVIFGVLWADLIHLLDYHWQANDQYAFGRFVPILAIGLFWKKWIDRPRAEPLGSSAWLVALVAVLVLALLPVRIVYEVNPDWPLPSWIMTAIVIALTLHVMFLMGGWSWVRHFCFPICFICVAVGWPYRLEHGLTQGLMRAAAAITVEALGWLDVPSLQRGNLIEVSNGVVGIDEACSGIRSLQSTVMASLFLGELYRLKWLPRFTLVAGGVMVSFFFNICRTLILTWRCSTAGAEGLESWHDPVGMIAFCLALGCLWGLAFGLMTVAGESGGQSTAVQAVTSVLPNRFLLGIGCWSLCVLGTTETWYRSHENQKQNAFYWSFKFPTNCLEYTDIELTTRVKKEIGYDSGGACSWKESDETRWQAYYFRWNATGIKSIFQARIHRPERCLPAAGLRQIADAGVEKIEAHGLELPFREYTFEAEGKILQVFFCQWEDGSEKQEGMWSSKLGDRLRSVLVGRRRLGQQTLELVANGPATLSAAEATLRKALPVLTQVESAY